MPPAGKDQKKIIIIKKKGGHHDAHHGGSWKVAYADFVTAMMAFFMVMWIVGMDDSAKESIQGYFANPIGFKKGYGSGSSPLATGQTFVVPRPSPPLPSRMAEEAAMKAVEERLKGAFEGSEFDGLREHVDVVLSSEGLRIEFGEGLIGDATFASGSAKMTVPMLRAITILGGEIAALPHDVIIEGHTDGVPLQRAGGYSNWELSSDRANAARRALQGQGVAPGRIASVRGLADRYPKISDFPMDPRNRRISVLLPFRATVASAPPADAAIAADTSADTR